MNMVCAWFKLSTEGPTLWNYCLLSTVELKILHRTFSSTKKATEIARKEALHPMRQHQAPWATSSRLRAKSGSHRPALQEQFALESRILCQITCKLMDNFPTSILPGAYKLETAICCELEWNAVFQSSSEDVFNIQCCQNSLYSSPFCSLISSGNIASGKSVLMKQCLESFSKMQNLFLQFSHGQAQKSEQALVWKGCEIGSDCQRQENLCSTLWMWFLLHTWGFIHQHTNSFET